MVGARTPHGIGERAPDPFTYAEGDPEVSENPWLTAEPSTEPITIYTKPNCPACKLTEKALTKAGVGFEVIDLSQRPDIVEQLRSEGLLAAPVLEGPDGARTSGFRPDRIKALVAMVAPDAPGQAATPPLHDQPRPQPPLHRTHGMSQ